jgi:hypothetical protein
MLSGIALKEYLQARLVDGYLSIAHALYFLGVNIYANNLISSFGKAGTCDESYVSGADDSYVHIFRV